MTLRRLAFAAAAACALISAVGLPAAAAPAAPAAAPAAFHSERISVRVVGSGPDVVLIPGLASSAEVWDGLVARLSPTHRLHLVQLAGFAGTAPPPGDGEVFAPAVEELARYLRERGLKRPAIIGHSLGGAAALRLAETSPDLVGSVLVVDALPFYSAMVDPAATPQSVAPVAEAMRSRIMDLSPEAFAQAQEATVRMLVTNPDGRAKALHWSLVSDRRTMTTAMRDLMVTDLRPGLATVQVLVTVLYAWDEAQGVPAAADDAFWRREYAGLKGACLKRIDSTRHFIMYDQPDRFDAAVDAFLKGERC
jgi:pimeloyl-ACP methyl ester carboxylesterase